LSQYAKKVSRFAKKIAAKTPTIPFIDVERPEAPHKQGLETSMAATTQGSAMQGSALRGG